jgi:hypothetical protein
MMRPDAGAVVVGRHVRNMRADTLGAEVESDVDRREQQCSEVWWTCDVLAMPETRYARNDIEQSYVMGLSEGGPMAIVSPRPIRNARSA